MQDELKIIKNDIQTIKLTLASVMSVLVGILENELIDETNLHTRQVKSEVIADYEELITRLVDCSEELHGKT
jgi:hypothetical protein